MTIEFGCVGTPADIPLIRQAGFDFIEMSCKQLLAMSTSQLLQLAAELEKNSLSCKGFNAYCPKEIVIAGESFDLKAARVYAKKAALLGSSLGIAHVGIGSPFSRILPEGFDRKIAEEQARSFFSFTADEFGAYGIRVGIEALGRCYCNYINQLWEAVSLAKKLKHPWLGVCLDFYNMEQNGEADCSLEDAIPFVYHVHISDDAGSPCARYFLKPEKAQLHQRRLQALQAAGYDKSVSLEIDLPVDLGLAAKSLSLIKKAFTNSRRIL